MSLNNTGVLNFYWPPIQDADFYKIKFYKNDSFYSLESTSSTGYQLSGLYEGERIKGTVYHSIDSQLSATGYQLPEQVLDVFNFHSIGSGLSFSNFYINGLSADFIKDQNPVNITGQYFDNNTIIGIDVQNPRNNQNISYVDQEPFLTGVKHRSITSLYDNTEFTDINEFTFESLNTGLDRDFITQIVVQDFYNSGITGNLYLKNEPISLNRISKSNRTIESYFISQITCSYSNITDYAEYYFYDNFNFTGTPFITGNTFNPESFTINFPVNTTGYFKLIPYDWFGSGHAFYDPDYFYSNIPIYNPTIQNTFTGVNVSYSDSYGNIDVIANYVNASNTGSAIYLSIDSGNNSSFNVDSFFTGELYPNSGYTFNYFENLNSDYFERFNTTITQPFYFNFRLYSSGNQTLESTNQLAIDAIVPTILSSGIQFDYQLGITSLEFSTEPLYNFTGIDVLVSGKGDSNYQLYTGVDFTSQDIEHYAIIKLVKSSDNAFVFDEIYVSGAGLKPALNISNTLFSNSDSTLHFNLNQNIEYGPITDISTYGKYIFEDVSTGDQFIGDDLNELLQFNDFSNYYLQQATQGTNLFQAPTGLKQDSIYEATGIIDTTGALFTGFYESGSHFVYRFVPYNGYGSGYVSDPLFVKFPFNASTQNQQEEINSLNEDVEGLKNNFTKLYGDTLSIPSGYCYLNVDYSVAGFATPPHVVATLSTPNQEDPILGLMVSGEPTTGSATFVLSDTAESNDYKLKYLAAE